MLPPLNNTDASHWEYDSALKVCSEIRSLQPWQQLFYFLKRGLNSSLMKTWLDILCSLHVGSRDGSLFHRARRQTACPGSGPQRRAAVAGDTFACNFCHLLLEGRGSMTETSHISAEEAIWYRCSDENCIPVDLVSSGTSVAQLRAHFSY